MTGIITVNGGFANAFDQNIDQEDLSRMEEQQEITDQLDTAKQRTKKTGSGIESGFFALTQVWNGIKAMFSSIPVANRMISVGVNILGLPPWLSVLANGLAVGIIAFGVIWLYRGVMP